MYKAKFIDEKLMLISTDIQVGDKVTVEGFHSEAWFNIVAILSDITESNQVCLEEALKRNSYKVIGEILTPGITENQQFTEKEIEFLTIGGIRQKIANKEISQCKLAKELGVTQNCISEIVNRQTWKHL